MSNEMERLRAENMALRAFVEMIAKWEPYLDSGGLRCQGCHSFTPYDAIRQHEPLQHREGCPVMKAKAVLAKCDVPLGQ